MEEFPTKRVKNVESLSLQEFVNIEFFKFYIKEPKFCANSEKNLIDMYKNNYWFFYFQSVD